MPILKIEQTEDTLTIEGEIDIEFDITGMHPGFPTEDEDIFNKATIEMKTYGDILLKDIEGLMEWVNKKSVSINSKVLPKEPSKWPEWKITIQRKL